MPADVRYAREFADFAIAKGERSGYDFRSCFDGLPLGFTWDFKRDGRRFTVYWKNSEIWYHLHGDVNILPQLLAGSESEFAGRWHDAGVVEDFEAAYNLAVAWLFTRAEVDDLPLRDVRNYGI
ncbi:MAG: hypothetical protein AB7K09_04890 [Planctomycetota bacterium]